MLVIGINKRNKKRRVHHNGGPLKILEKRERGRIQRLPKIFEYSLLPYYLRNG